MPRLPSPYNKQSGVGGCAGVGPGSATSIPLPATVAATRRCPPDKVRPVPTPTHQSPLGGLKQGNGGVGSASSSRSTSPSQQQTTQTGLSFIPQPRSQNTNRQGTGGTPSPRTSAVGRPSGIRTTTQACPYSSSGSSTGQNKNSVLDKFKLFNNKDKNQERGKATSGVSKRTSSSSGFSSARSEHSDSSTSLCDQSKIQVEPPKSRVLKSKLQSSKQTTKQASPKTIRKEQNKTQSSKIARTKASIPEKLTGYSNLPVDDVKKESGKIANVCAKLPMDKKTSNLQDLLKNHSSTQSQKTNNPTVVTTPSKQISQQESKNISNSSRNELPIKQTTPRPKMELPGKITDPKVHLQALKVPPNGVNKDMLMQKNLLPNANGIISRTDQEDANVTNMRNNPSPFDRHTQCMNQANLPYERIVEKEMDINVGESNMEDRKQDSSISETLSGSPWKMQNATTHEEEKIIKDSPEVEEEEEEDVKINGLPVSNESTPGSSRDDPRGRSNSENKDLTVKDESMNSEPPTSQVQNTNVHVHVFPQGKQILGGPFQGPTLSVTGPCSSIPKPTALVKGTSKPPKENNGPSMPTPTKLKGEILHRAKLDPNTVAMVSPMPSISDLMSESSHSNSNSTGQSNSSDSSVIYRPSSESGSEIKTIPNRKIDTTFEQMEKVLSEGSTCGSGSGGGGGGSLADDEAEMTVKPMQPLLRGYTPGARALQTLPSRTTARQYTILHSSSHHHVSHDYADIDIASGYLSDGEVLRGGMSVGSRTLSDLCDGYMSEGGASLYARRINPAYGHDRER